MANQYGSEVGPGGPLQDMSAFDAIAGTFPPRERDTSPAEFTGGTGGDGLGGTAEPAPTGKLNAPGGGPTPGSNGSPLAVTNG